MTERLAKNPAERIDRGARVSFTFDGRRYQGFAGDSIGSALAAADVKVLSRSFKYHRPRGLLCANGRCPNCLVEVDGTPSVRACTEPIRAGMKVRSQNAWPSLGFDVFSFVDRMDRFLPVGFYYKVFHRPRALWPLFERILRRIAGLGRIDVRRVPHTAARTVNLARDVVVVGGGPAGCLAALEAAASGASVLLVDDQRELGGHVRFAARVAADADPRIAGLAGHAAAERLRALVAGEARIEALPETTVFGVYEGGMLGATRGETYYRIRATAIVVAAGAQERPLLFENNDLPGIVLGSAALRLAREAGVPVGRRLAVIVDDAHGWRVAESLRDAGLSVAVVADLRDAAPPESAAALADAGLELMRGVTVVSAAGAQAVRALSLRTAGGTHEIECDAVVIALRPEPVTALVAQGGTRAFDERIGEFLPAAREANLVVAGEVEGLHDDAFVTASGVAAGREAAALAGARADPQAAAVAREARRASSLAALGRRVELPVRESGKCFVCVCEDITGKELAQGVDEGFDELELLKRYSTATMGPCQGKMCHVSSARQRAARAKQSLAQTGLTTARPPFHPVTLGTLAGPHLAPVRRTAMHALHEATRPQWTDLGDWKRTYIHTTVERECRAVREAAGIIDVSSLGKFEVSGPDAGAFLDWLHPNTFSDLRQGRVRYRAMCDDAGIILDDGTVARLGPERFFLSTTSSGTEAVAQWLTWWLAGTSRRVHVTNVTSHLAAVNLAGPRSREVLAKLTSLDTSREKMPYLAAIEGEVAGIPAIILRIGFVGELSYEIHVPADYGAALWEALVAAGKEFGIEPFGVEAQRVLRLEKQHLIVGQDTDALTSPLEAGLDWMVKLDRPDFIGRAAMKEVARRGPKTSLVGFEIPARTVPAEGVAIMNGGRLAGRVTSAKWSDSLGRTIGLAVVSPDLGTEGGTLQIRHDGALVEARVRRTPFYDPEGARLRS